ncbi:hypothetical protein LCGC14_1034150, partial [marine sediment metagenome]
IIPVGGLGSRFDNDTFDRPKCLLPVLGNKLVIDYVLENLKSINIDEVIMVLGYRGEQIRDYVLKNYDYNFTFVQQTKRFGELGYAMLLGFSEIKQYEKGNTECIVFIGDTILDPFAGSFTTTCVARDLERNSIGMEISEEYVKKAKEKMGFYQKNLFQNIEYIEK